MPPATGQGGCNVNVNVLARQNDLTVGSMKALIGVMLRTEVLNRSEAFLAPTEI